MDAESATSSSLALRAAQHQENTLCDNVAMPTINKYYGMLFKCLSTLELSFNMTISQFLKCPFFLLVTRNISMGWILIRLSYI